MFLVAPQTEVRLNVTHLQTNRTKRIPLFKDFDDFVNKIQFEFKTELGQDSFTLYRFPYGAVDISRREKILESNYAALRNEFTDTTTSSAMPGVYVWSITKEEDNPSPDQKDVEDGTSGSGRSVPNSTLCKKGQNWICMACGSCYDKDNKLTLEAAHILEFNKRKKYSAEEFEELLDNTDLIGLEEMCNHISLCNICHNDYFDTQLIGTNVDEEGNYSWIVKESVFKCMMPNGGTYSDIHGKAINFQFDQQKPPIKLILHRLKRYHEGKVSNTSSNSSNNKRSRNVCTNNSVVPPIYTGGNGDREAFIKFLKDAGMEDVTAIEECWRKGTTVIEPFQRTLRSSDWEKVIGPNIPGVTAQFYINKTTGVLKFKIKGG